MTLMAIEVTGLPAADEVQCELAEVDEQFHRIFGADESAWLPAQREAYNTAIDEVWAARCPSCHRSFEDCTCGGGVT